jgi:MFS family permease
MNKKNIIGLLGLAGFVVMADNWVVSPILPAIAENLDVDITKAGLLISAYMVPFGLFQLIFGPLADRYGKKQVITFSMVIFTLATGLCALGAGLFDLSLYRALTGVFAASVMPISLALIGDIFPLQERQGAIGTFMGIAFLGQGLSMAIGGITAYFVSWRGVFALYALLSVIPTLMLMKSYKALPSTRNPQSRLLAPYAKLLGDRRSLGT